MRRGRCPERHAKPTYEVVYSILLIAYPRNRREADGEVMLGANRVRYELARVRGGWALVDFWVRLVLWDIVKDVSSERLAQGKEWLRTLGDERALLALGGAAAIVCSLLITVNQAVSYATRDAVFDPEHLPSQIGVSYSGPMIPRWVENPLLGIVFVTLGWMMLCMLARGWWRLIAAMGLSMVAVTAVWEVYEMWQFVDPIEGILWSYDLPFTGMTLHASDVDSAARWAAFAGVIVVAVAVARSSTLGNWSALPLLLAALQCPSASSLVLWGLEYLTDHVTVASYWWYAHLAKLMRYGFDILSGAAWLVLGLALLRRRTADAGRALLRVRA